MWSSESATNAQDTVDAQDGGIGMEFSVDVEQRTLLTSGDGQLTLADLPALPERDLASMRSQASYGALMIAMTCAMMVFLTHGMALTLWRESFPADWRWLPLTLIYAEVGLAFVLWSAMMLGDPGTLQPQTQTGGSCLITGLQLLSAHHCMHPRPQHLPA